MRALQNDRAQNKTLIVDSKLGYGAGSSRMFSASRGSGCSTSWGTPTGAPSKTGKVALDKLKRGIFDHKRERPTAQQMPAHVLAQRVTRLRQAPAHMVRMAQNEAPRNMVLSRQASASVAKKPEPRPSTNWPNITQRPVPQKSVAPPTRTSLPAGQQFHAPKLKKTVQESGVAPAPKRKREEYSMFQPKKRKF